MMFEKIVQTGICTLLQIPCESAVAFCKNPSPKAIMHGFLPATVSVAEMLQFERLLSLVFPALGTAGVESFLPDRELADSVLQVSVSANKQVVEELRGDENMCQALLEIMEPEINKIKYCNGFARLRTGGCGNHKGDRKRIRGVCGTGGRLFIKSMHMQQGGWGQAAVNL